MRKNLILTFAFLIIFALGVQAISAQITINIPKIPKIGKIPKTDDSSNTNNKNTNNQTNNTNNNQTDSNQTNQKVENNQAPQDQTPGMLSYYMEEIGKAKRLVDKFTPEGQLYIVDEVGEEWLLFAISPKSREKLMTKDKEFADWEKTHPNNKFDALIADLATSAARQIPTYKPNPKFLAFHSPAEEKMMESKLSNLTGLKIIKTGLVHSSWQIETNSIGIPTDRYKWGYIWARNPNDDHPYCHLYHVNVIQQYAGGGTYGATYAKFIRDEIVGCAQ